MEKAAATSHWPCKMHGSDDNQMPVRGHSQSLALIKLWWTSRHNCCRHQCFASLHINWHCHYRTLHTPSEV